MNRFTQEQVYHASFCLLSPEQLGTDHCDVTMMAADWQFFGYPAVHAEPLVVPFVCVALDPQRQVWAVDLPGLTTLAWVTISHEVYRENPDFYLHQAESLLLDQVQSELRASGLQDSDWYYFYTWQPVDDRMPCLRNLVLGAYLRTIDHEPPIMLVAETYDGIPLGNPMLN